MAIPTRILVPCMDWTRPAGGVQKLYRHVDVLNANGIEAIIMHQEEGFRCTWFENRTAVSSFGQVAMRPTDVLMVPEILAWQFVTIAPQMPKVIFSQNAYQTFAWRTDQHNINPYLHPDFRAVIVVSDDSRAYLQYAFPRQQILRIRYSIDPTLFYFEPAKKRQIAYMPRKKENDARQILAILKHRGVLNGWELVKIEDKSQSETARILRESAIFLSFSMQEGWGLPPMEAMACGCATIGYDGRGGREYLKEPYATSIEPEDIPSFAAAIENTLRKIDSDPPHFLDRTRQASRFIQEMYAPGGEAEDIIGAWRKILPSL